MPLKKIIAYFAVGGGISLSIIQRLNLITHKFGITLACLGIIITLIMVNVYIKKEATLLEKERLLNFILAIVFIGALILLVYNLFIF